MDRKYRQRGYKDTAKDKERLPKQAPAQKGEIRTPRMPAFKEVTRCALCGTGVNIDLGGVAVDARCTKCNSDLHSCKNCINFDPGARFQCRKPVTERVVKKDLGNNCELFEPKKTIERETTTAPTDLNDPRAAFDRLFKK